MSHGSGFVIRPGFIATNYHVIEGIQLKLSKVRLTGSGKDLPIEAVITTDETYDLAILRCSRVKAPPLTLGNSAKVQVGEVVYVTGAPRGYTGTFSAGVISAVRDNQFRSSDDVIQFSAPVSPGSSGGPVMNSRGQVIGVVMSQVSSARDVNFASPINALKPLIQEGVWGN